MTTLHHLLLVLSFVGFSNIIIAQKPNVIVIYTDDHRYTGVHALGGQDVKTPAMDGLVENGVSFSNAYLMGAFHGATCAPSRAMLHTGRNLFELQGQGFSIPEEHKTLGETLRKEGYYSHIIGKWHQDKESLVRSFNSGSKIMGIGLYLVDHFRMPLWEFDRDPSQLEPENAFLLKYDKLKNITKVPFDKAMKKGPIANEDEGPHTSEVFATEAAKFLKEYKKDAPFFMYLAFHAPHDPRQAPQKYRDMYPAKEIQLTPSYLPVHPFDNGDMTLRDEALAPWPRTEMITKQQLADYYAIITHLDDQIAKVIAALKASGKYENTVIVFAGDSGLAVGNHGLMGKQNLYNEDGIHIPLVFSGGAIKQKGIKTDALTYNFDIYPTICDMLKIQTPSSVSGKSLLPIINKTKTVNREHQYFAYKQFQRAYRKGDYKLIEYVKAKTLDKESGEVVRGSRVTQLYNIKTDPWEVNNLAFMEENLSLVKTLQIEMQKEAKKLGDYMTIREGEQYSFWDFY
ncbi:sulfatase-like hydrolase/transferase [Arcticibacterium luteifluviistationis]|uniref:Arylsulfatase n=1 Tax=Arcticibacterium luteifluviistationis TaxID=1784714 RepID=A0A2Z4GD89_9BACT|nr:sulfatase-like hydrolase/transferase [Arcticibacterium luteifluviistationis]AWV99282.1 arylsulfatase [Arcticibacterium luteifluviistationis]